ncbi:flagellar motor protein MotB [Stakelama marina]|uniref:Flagellar motor protein MotB n=1 Tax=Stakelama marina TaxID=2826939 RepID=A0A8T4IL89_9SPHN|nr:flagellar motor protein MotB [Stakelama marina]MBR0553119.1 flagellar motor protein MotB [Stakelama marina]
MTPAAVDRFEAPRSARPVWLTTLADLGLLLVGFFAFLQANRQVDGTALADGLRAGFVAQQSAGPAPMAVDISRVAGFAPGAATGAAVAPAVIAWARGAAADPRTAIRLAGSTDGSAVDVDGATGSAAILANDRARFVAVALLKSGAVRPDQLVIAPEGAEPKGRSVTLSLGYAGQRQ